MTTLDGRPNTALLVIDMQNDLVAGAHRRDSVIAAIDGLVDRARATSTPVVWIQHSDAGLPVGTDDWQIVPELTPAAGEPVVAKNHGDAFEGTTLETVLADNAAGRLVVTGAETDICIRSTLHSAFFRGYDVTLVGDAHTAGDKTAHGAPPVPDVIAHTNLYWNSHSAPGRTAGTRNADAITFP